MTNKHLGQVLNDYWSVAHYTTLYDLAKSKNGNRGIVINPGTATVEENKEKSKLTLSHTAVPTKQKANQWKDFGEVLLID